MMSNDLNWNGKLEAVHTDGRVVPVSVVERDKSSMPYLVASQDDELRTWAYPEGGCQGGWTIRNVATPAAVEFGPEIKVDGKRPEWLGDDDRIQWATTSGQYNWWRLNSFRGYTEARGMNWEGIGFIRLPADHPHYRTHSPATPTLSLSTGVDRLERYEGFLRRLAGFSTYEDPAALIMEARGLVAEMPALPDPDLVKAREIVASQYELCGALDEQHRKDWAQFCRNGKYDEHRAVRAALAGIKAGREMGR